MMQLANRLIFSFRTTAHVFELAYLLRLKLSKTSGPSRTHCVRELQGRVSKRDAAVVLSQLGRAAWFWLEGSLENSQEVCRAGNKCVSVISKTGASIGSGSLGKKSDPWRSSGPRASSDFNEKNRHFKKL